MSGSFRSDMAGTLAGAASALAGARRELEARLRQRAEALLAGVDLVRREEFEAVRDMAVLARQENERLQARIEALEARHIYTTGDLAARLGLSERTARSRLRAAGIAGGAGHRHRWTKAEFDAVLERLAAEGASRRRPAGGAS